MARLVWDKRNHEAGLYRGVFYPPNGAAEAWNGLISVRESPSGADEQVRYLDGQKLSVKIPPGEFSGTIEAFTYPDALDEVKNFGLSYRTNYKLHLVYNASVEPSPFSYQQVDPGAFSWSFATKAVPVPGAKPTAHIVIDTSKTHSWTVAQIEDILYGSDLGFGRLPLPTEILDIFEANAIVKVVDHGDGTFTVTGPDEAIQMLDPTTFEITWPSAIFIDENNYTISSM